MKVLLIHGIGQEASTKSELLQDWIDVLEKAHPDLLKDHTVDMAYYGTTLADWANGRNKSAVAMGGECVDVDIVSEGELRFLSAAMEQFVSEQGVDEAKIQSVADDAIVNAVAMDNFLARRVNGLLRVIESLSPAKGALFLRLIRQGYTYLSSPAATKAVDAIVRPLLLDAPQVLLTHSLGTVIAFKILREMEAEGIQVHIPLFVTMGSPLALDAFKKKMGPPRRKPSLVGSWLNFYDPSDFVTLGKPLDSKNFASNIENDDSVDNRTVNSHGVIGYLPHLGVVRAVQNTLKIDNRLR